MQPRQKKNPRNLDQRVRRGVDPAVHLYRWNWTRGLSAAAMSGAGHEPCIPGGPYSPSRETFKKPLLTGFSAEERLLLVRCADHLLSEFRSHVCDAEGFALMPPEHLIAEAITTQHETADMMNSVSSIDDWYEDDALLKEILGAEKTIQHIAGSSFQRPKFP